MPFSDNTTRGLPDTRPYDDPAKYGLSEYEMFDAEKWRLNEDPAVPIEEKLQKIYFDKGGKEAIQRLGGPEGVLGTSFIKQGRERRGGRVEFDEVQEGCVALVMEEYGVTPHIIEKYKDEIRLLSAELCGYLKQAKSLDRYLEMGGISGKDYKQQLLQLRQEIVNTLYKLRNREELASNDREGTVERMLLDAMSISD